MRWPMRWVMTRVLPLPAPARMRVGPSVASTASRCCAFSPASNEDSDMSVRGHHLRRGAFVVGGFGGHGPPKGRRIISAAALFDCHGFREVARLVDVASGAYRHVVRP